MLSGEPIPVHGVGHIISPKLKTIFPCSGVGYTTYSLYLNVLSWDSESFKKYATLVALRGIDKVCKDGFSIFDKITLLPHTRELCRDTLSFFMSEEIVWDDKTRAYLAFSPDEGLDEPRAVGTISRDNFDEVRTKMLRMNYVGVDKDDAPTSFQDENAKRMWGRVQGYLADAAKTPASEDKGFYHIGNIVSKLCVVHPSYNLLNVADLTIFQLYDQFFQYCYLRGANLSEMIFSNHGGDHFTFDDWLKPVFKHS